MAIFEKQMGHVLEKRKGEVASSPIDLDLNEGISISCHLSKWGMKVPSLGPLGRSV